VTEAAAEPTVPAKRGVTRSRKPAAAAPKAAKAEVEAAAEAAPEAPVTVEVADTAAAAPPELKPIPFDQYERQPGSAELIPGTNVRGEAPIIELAGRKIVMRDINGVQVPFYLSSGLAGKKDVEAGKWYPILGIGPDGWINKGSQQEINDYYGSPELRDAAQQLDATIGDIRNDTSIPKVKPTGAHLDAINAGLNPTANGLENTREVFDANLKGLLARISGNKQGLSGIGTEGLTGIGTENAAVDAETGAVVEVDSTVPETVAENIVTDTGVIVEVQDNTNSRAADDVTADTGIVVETTPYTDVSTDVRTTEDFIEGTSVEIMGQIPGTTTTNIPTTVNVPTTTNIPATVIYEPGDSDEIAAEVVLEDRAPTGGTGGEDVEVDVSPEVDRDQEPEQKVDEPPFQCPDGYTAVKLAGRWVCQKTSSTQVGRPTLATRPYLSQTGFAGPNPNPNRGIRTMTTTQTVEGS
jgi:hypothetical protein